MVKIERTSTAPPSLAVEKKKASGEYNKEDVMDQLYQDFHGKCYLCGIKPPYGIEVEHLRPHKGDIDRKFDWNNLFLSCRHCNSVKNQGRYDDMILDCCVVDPEKVFAHRLSGGHVQVTPSLLPPTLAAVRTGELLTECFETQKTGIRKKESKIRKDALSMAMNLLYKKLLEHQQAPSDESLELLQTMLSRTYKFAGFTRADVRENLEMYPDLADYVR